MIRILRSQPLLPFNVPPLGIVAALSRNRVIGKSGALPWHLPEDLRHFRRITLGHAVIMGRKTHESIGKPLAERRNIVVSSQSDLGVPGCDIVPSLSLAVTLAREYDPRPMVIGGASLFRLALPDVSHMFLTEIDQEVEGDTFFPPFDRRLFRVTETVDALTPGVRFVTLERIT